MADSLQETKLCKQCGQEFVPGMVHQKFCTHECNVKWWDDNHPRKNSKRTCIICGAEFISPMGNHKTCSKECNDERERRVHSAEYKNKHTNFENRRARGKKYYKENASEIKQKVKKRHYRKLKEDSLYKLLCGIRSRVRAALKKQRTTRGLQQLIGCSLPELQEHLQMTAVNNGYDNFNIKDYDTKVYHIDHIKPCSSFDFTKEEDISLCFHFSNLQILTAEENLKKHTKIAV